MVNIETGRIVDILESREVGAVSEWLKEYPNIKQIARDNTLLWLRIVCIVM
jgi:hypothetical protein